MNGHEFGKEAVGLNLRHYAGIYVIRLLKNMKIGQDSPVRYFHHKTSKYNSEA